MTCKECLAALRTESLREMAPDSPVLQHCATCPDCARVTTMLRDKEYETATVLNNLPPMSSPLTVAENAVRTSQRRRVGRLVVMLSGVIGAIIIGIVGSTMVVPAMYRAGIMMDTDVRANPSSDMRGHPSDMADHPEGMMDHPEDIGLRTETLALSCLSPQQAGDIIGPYIRSDESRIHVPGSGISAITVRGTAAELAKSRELIREFEKNPGAACRFPATTVEKPPITPAPTGKGPGLLGQGKGTLLTPNPPATTPKK